MFCTSRVQAEQVAIAGALKMDAQGYTLEYITDTLVWVGLPEGRKSHTGAKGYTVETDPEMIAVFGSGKFCTCPFARDNQRWGTCKHLEWAQARLSEDAANAARIEAIEEYNDYARFDADDDRNGYAVQALPARSFGPNDAIRLQVPVGASLTATTAPKATPRIYPAPVNPDGFTDSDLCALCGTPREYNDHGVPLSFCERCEKWAL